MVRELIRFVAAAGLVSALSLAACTGSESVDLRRDSGAVTSSGEAGSGTGAAGTGGSSSGTGAGAGSSSSGAAGAGVAGQAGKPGSTGAAGTGTAGTGTTGTAGTTGSGGTTGAGGNKVDAGAGGTAATDAGVKVYTYSTGIENLLIQNCGGCHYAAPGVSIQGGFSFSYANVTGVTNGHPGCVGLDASKRRVVPGKPENSLLWIKAFNDSPPSGCGGHMPFQGSRLSPTTFDYLKAWILAGAPP